MPPTSPTLVDSYSMEVKNDDLKQIVPNSAVGTLMYVEGIIYMERKFLRFSLTDSCKEDNELGNLSNGTLPP
ncbi:unnamed protein product [Urochloa humidicola]